MTEVIVDVREGIGWLRLNRPARRNAFTASTLDQLAAGVDRLNADDTVGVAVLTGAGEHFCAGADLRAIAAQGSDPTRANPLDANLDANAPMGPSRLQLRKPVIAAVEGYAVAGGIELALWCDLRVASETAVFGVFCRRFGVPLIDGGTVRLPRLIGQSRALDLILTGRPVAAAEALQIGLANRITPAGQALVVATALARELAAFPQECLRNDRKNVFEQDGRDTRAALANEFELGMRTLASGEASRGAQTFAQGTGRHGTFNQPR